MTNPKTMEHAIGNQFRFKAPNMGGWQDRHRDAWFHPRKGAEVRIVRLIESLSLYAESHEYADDGGIGSDVYCGEYWLDMMRAARKLLSADIGRLDGGTLDGLLFDMVEAAGFTREDLDF